MPVPREIRQKYVSLATLRRNGDAVHTPVCFGEKDDKLYVMTRSDSGNKRARNNPQVRIEPCTMRGKSTGPQFAATARTNSSTGRLALGPQDDRAQILADTSPVPMGARRNVYLEIVVQT